MTTTTAPAPARFTYTAAVVPFDAMSMSGKFGRYYRAEITRSDGAVIWKGSGYSSETDARNRSMVNVQLGRLRRYYRTHGVCWHDRRTAVKDHAKAREKVRNETARELMGAASQGTHAAFRGEPRTVCPFATDTAQGITWTEAWRLATDRLSDSADENPTPEAA